MNTDEQLCAIKVISITGDRPRSLLLRITSLVDVVRIPKPAMLARLD